MIVTLLEKHQIPFDILTDGKPANATPHELASALNVPLAYIGEADLFVSHGRKTTVIRSAAAELDAAAVASALGPGSQPAAQSESDRVAWSCDPLTAMLWDARLWHQPILCIPSPTAGQALRIETRRLTGLNLPTAALTRRPTAPASSAYDALLARGFVDRVTDEDKARQHLNDPSVSGYIGFDPTADSLHVGSLMPIMALAHLQQAGGKAIAVVGGATGMIGDPSGKTAMRRFLTAEDIEANRLGISRQLSVYLKLDDDTGCLLDNAAWFADVPCLEFLRELGAYFPIRMMLNKECFRARMEREGEGLTYLELTYMLMQAYDFVRLAEARHCLVQMGGSDQWGNICAGVELGRKAKGQTLFGYPVRQGGELVGLTFSLLRNAAGGKFGKTEHGNVWLDEAKTSVYDFFQFWRNAADSDVRRFLGVFTFLPMDAVEHLCQIDSAEKANVAKEILAFAVTTLAHGKAKALAAAENARALFGGYSDGFRNETVRLGLATQADFSREATDKADVSGLTLTAAELKVNGLTVLDVLTGLKLVQSKNEARRLIRQGGAYIDDQRVDSEEACIPAVPAGTDLVIRAGKKKHGKIRII